MKFSMQHLWKTNPSFDIIICFSRYLLQDLQFEHPVESGIHIIHSWIVICEHNANLAKSGHLMTQFKFPLLIGD